MAKDKALNGKSVSLKKEIYQQITGQLSTTLPAVKEILGEKKFEKRVKRAAKLLSQGIKAKAPKKVKEVKKKINGKKVEIPETVVEN
jgi:hypothetical protein